MAELAKIFTGMEKGPEAIDGNFTRLNVEIDEKTKEITKERVLWSGSASNVGSKITLTDSLSKYSYIIIGYSNNSDSIYIRKGITAEITIRSFNQGEEGELWLKTCETILSSDGDKTITIKQASAVSRNSDGSITVSNIQNDKISINQIRGVRNAN